MIDTMILLIIYYFMLYTTVFWIMVMLKNRSKMFKDPAINKYPGVSIIIPAYNEARHIRTAVKSCLALNYPQFEIIVIDDGSTDKTAEICKEFGKTIRLISKKNEGKATALNAGIAKARYEFIACLDADSKFHKDSLKSVMGYFGDKNVGAVTTAMKAANAKTFFQKIQYIEYLFSIYLRKLMSFIDAIYVTPGPGSIYRKAVLNEIGGFDVNNIVEDTDMALQIQKRGYRIENSLNSLVHTEVPEGFRGLVKQRIRWYVGYMENVLGKHRDMLMNRKYPNLGLFMLPTSFIWLFAIIYMAVLFLWDFLSAGFNLLRNLIAINFDIAPYLGMPLRLDLTANIFIGFLVIFYAFSLTVLYLSTYFSQESKLGEKKLYFIYYLFIYFTLISLFWIISFFVFIKRKAMGEKSEWKGEKVN